MAEGELYNKDKLISEVYIGDGEIEQVYLKEIPYLPTDNFVPYTLTGLLRTIVKPVGQGVITDLQKVGSWYQTITRTNVQTCYRTAWRTIAGGTTVSSMNLNDGVIAGAWTFAIPNPPAKANHTLNSVKYEFMGSATGPSGATAQIGSYPSQGVLSSVSMYNSYRYWVLSFNASSLTTYMIRASVGSFYVRDITATAYWNDRQESYQEPYDCSTYYTNANFRSVNVPIDSNTTELVIENNSQIIGICRLYSSANANLGNLITNQNVKFASINNRAGASYNFELTCTNPGVNWFTGLFLKENYNNQSLNDIQYEFEIKTVNDLTTSQVSTAISADNNNRNIYSRKIIVNDIDFEHKALKKRVRSDRKNLVFVIKDQNVLLNHYFVNDTFYIEIPDKYLKSGEIVINCLVMPLDFVYNGRSEVYNLNTLALSSVDFEYY